MVYAIVSFIFCVQVFVYTWVIGWGVCWSGKEEGGAALLNTSLVTGSPADWKCGLEPQVLLLKDVTMTLGGALGRLEEDPGGKACLCERDKYRDLDGKSSPLSGPQRPTQDPHGPPPKRVITRLKTGLVTFLSFASLSDTLLAIAISLPLQSFHPGKSWWFKC